MITRENAKEWLPLVQALAEGKMLQFDLDGLWIATSQMSSTLPECYRIAPEPKRVPLTAEDIPAVCWVRQLPYTNQMLVVAIGYNHVEFDGERPSYNVLMEEGYEYSTDRKTWNPCWKEVAE